MAKPKTKSISIKIPESMYNDLLKMSVKENTKRWIIWSNKKIYTKGITN